MKYSDPTQPKDHIAIEGPVWSGEFQISKKGQETVIRITDENRTTIRGVLIGTNPLPVAIHKRKYNYRLITA